MSAFRYGYETEPGLAQVSYLIVIKESTQQKRSFAMDTMTFVTYCLAGFGGLVVIAAVVFVVSLFCEKKPDKKENSDK